MDIILYYHHSLDDWTVGLADISIFEQEVVLQEHLLEICYNSHENSRYVMNLKKMINIFICYTVNMCYNEIHQKKIFHLWTIRLGSVMFEVISSIP